MAWKTEKWLSDVFPGKEHIYNEYRLLPRRELAVIAASVFDIALAEILSRRLLDMPTEYETFLGLNEDGRAPCASFGAKIQLSLLLGIITVSDASVLRTIKNIRNKIAHRVKADLHSPEVLPLIYSLHDQLVANSNKLIAMGLLPGELIDTSLVRQFLQDTPEAGAGIIIVALTLYQAYFHMLSQRVTRVPPIERTSVTIRYNEATG